MTDSINSGVTGYEGIVSLPQAFGEEPVEYKAIREQAVTPTHIPMDKKSIEKLDDYYEGVAEADRLQDIASSSEDQLTREVYAKAAEDKRVETGKELIQSVLPDVMQRSINGAKNPNINPN